MIKNWELQAMHEELPKMRKGTGPYDALIDEVEANPGKWLQYRPEPNDRGQANSAAQYLRRLGLEVKVRTADDVSYLFIRYEKK